MTSVSLDEYLDRQEIDGIETDEPFWAIHLQSGGTVHACDRHLTDAQDEYALDDKPLSVAKIADDGWTSCDWC